MIDIDLMVPDEETVLLLKRRLKRGLISQEGYDMAFGLLEAWRPVLKRRISLEEFEADIHYKLDDDDIIKVVLTQNKGSELWYYEWGCTLAWRRGVALIDRGKVIYTWELARA